MARPEDPPLTAAPASHPTTARAGGAGAQPDGWGRPDALAIAALLALWAIPAFVIGFAGDFSLNDDFAYQWTVRHWFEHGEHERISWTWIPSVTNALWGLLFLEAAGEFDLAALRFSTWTASAITVVATYALAREAGADRRIAALASALLAVNPVFVNLSFTFMTDIPYLCCTTLALLGLLRFMRSGSVVAWTVVVVFGVGATLIRQTGLAVPLTFAGLAVLAVPFRWRNALAAAVCGAVVAGAFAAFSAAAAPDPTMANVPGPAGTPELYGVGDVLGDLFGSSAFYHALRHGWMTVGYAGLFLWPLALIGATRRDAWIALPTAALGLAIATAFIRFEPWPWLNIVRETGIGVTGLRGEDLLPQLPMSVRWIVTYLSLAGGTLLVWRIVRWIAEAPRERLRDPVLLAGLGLAAGALGAYFVRSPYFDRYVLSAFTAGVVVAVRVLSPSSAPPRLHPVGWTVAAGWMAAVLVVGMLGTRATFEVARTQWAMLDDLLASGAPNWRIDGGFAWNGEHYDWEGLPVYTIPSKRRFVNDDTWVLSYAPTMPGYRVIDTRAYSNPLVRGEHRLYLHEAIESRSIATPEPAQRRQSPNDR